MKINNRFFSRLLAGFVVATVIATSTPVSALAEEISPASEIVEAQQSEEVEQAEEYTIDDAEENTEISDVEEEAVTEQTIAEEKDIEEIKEDTSIVSDSLDSSEEEQEEEVDVFFEEMTEAAQDALPLSSVITETSQYGPTKIQWRTSATDPYVPNTKAGTIRFVTQNPASPLYSSLYWGGYPSQNECGITCQSMALSYLGVQHQPGDLLNYGGGVSRIGTSYWTNIVGGYDHQGYNYCNGTDLKQAINNYLGNSRTNPKYSPVFIHLNNYPLSGGYAGSHYILIIGVKDESKNIYETLDPWDNNVTEVTLKFGTHPTVSYKAFTSQISDSIDEFYQFIKPSGSAEIKPTVPDPTPSDPVTPSPSDSDFTKVDNKDAVVLANEVRIRKGPSTSDTVITTVNKHKKVVVVAKSTEWYKIKFTLNGVTKTGYIYREYVGLGKRPSTVSFSLKKYYNNRIKISWTKQTGVTGYRIKRYNPTTGTYKTIKTIVGNTKFSYMDTGLKNGKTYKYRVYAYKTWTHQSSYTLYSPKPTAKSVKTCSYMLAKTTGSLLNVRKGPGTNYPILKTLKNAGVEVRVYSLSKSWYKVKLKINKIWKTGYIYKDYIKLS